MSPSNFHVVEHKLPCQHIREYPAATTNTQEDVLYLVVKQYIPVNNQHPQPGDVTIVASTANGIPKEAYEPLWDDIYTCSQAQGIRIRGIWIADVAHQGKSGLINEDSAGNDPSVYDHSRDLLHFINLKREDMPRPIVGIGHSLGATSLVHLSLFHPRLFHTLALFDPIILRQVTPLANGNVFDPKDQLEGYIASSTYRQDTWPSREAAAASFRRSAFFRSWDPRALDRWIQYGLRSISAPSHELGKTHEHGHKDGQEGQKYQDPVTLTTTVAHEVSLCGRPYYNRRFQDVPPSHPDNRLTHPDVDPMLLTSFPFYRPESSAVFHQLPRLRPSVLYIFGGKSPVALPELRADKIRNTGTGVGGSGGVSLGRVLEVYFDNLGHLLALEGPMECADAITRWLGPELRRWKEEEQFFHDTWYSKSKQEKTAVDPQWSKHVPRIGRKPKEQSGGGVRETSKL